MDPPSAPVTVVQMPNLGKVLHKPSEYDGKDRNACHTFVAQLRLYISGNPSLFTAEESKVLFAATYLRGKAFSWIEPKLANPTSLASLAILSDFNTFCLELIRNLGDPDREKNMAKKLNGISQTSSAANYRTEFDNISQYLTWDDSALRAKFYDGLKSDVKDALSYVLEEPNNYKDFQDLCIRLDNRIYERKTETRGRTDHRTKPVERTVNRTVTRTFPTPRTSSSTTTSNRTSTGPVPMDLDATRSKKFKPLTPQERQKRIDNNLCLYSGESGHRAGQCPTKRKLYGNQIRATIGFDNIEDSDQSGSKN